MQDFDFISACSIAEAIAVLHRENGSASILAGGTDLLVQLREGRRKTGVVVDIKRIPDLTRVSADPGGGLTIGSGASCLQIVEFCRARGIYPGFVAAVELIGGIQIQGRATVGGNLCNASPAADSIPALIVHGALCRVGGPDGVRDVPVSAFCLAPGRTVLREGEMLISIHLPPVPRQFGAHYLRFTPRNEMDIAVAGAAAGVELDPEGRTFVAARLAFSAVAPTPLLVTEAGAYLVGKTVSAETIAEAARISREAARPLDDMRGTAAQRKHLTGVLARRALETAVDRARATQPEGVRQGDGE